MRNKALVLAFLRRAVILGGISVVMVLAVSEAVYFFQRDKSSRPATTINLTIPAGTAGRVAQGESPPEIPESMIFVVGDILQVLNEDEVDHQLGPLYIPAGMRATLVMSEANDYAYSCSFRPTRYLDLTVRQATTWVNRLQAVAYGAPPTLMFLLVYSFIFYPLKLVVARPGA